MSPKIYLVIIDNSQLPYKDRYRVYKSLDLAMEWAKKNGWDDQFGLFKDEVGQYTLYSEGDIQVGILPLLMRH